MTTEQQHAHMVECLVKPGADILATLTPDKVDLWHAGTGVATEGGEALDAVKRWCIYNKELDRQNVIEELGDLEFYMRQVRNRIGVTREEVLMHNMAKLGERYKQFKYSDAAANARADKAITGETPRLL